VTITENDRRRKITKREAVIKQLVNKSASADARSLKIQLDLMLNLGARARSVGDVPAPEVTRPTLFDPIGGRARMTRPPTPLNHL
jgi:hypothetical protein